MEPAGAGRHGRGQHGRGRELGGSRRTQAAFWQVRRAGTREKARPRLWGMGPIWTRAEEEGLNETPGRMEATPFPFDRPDRSAFFVRKNGLARCPACKESVICLNRMYTTPPATFRFSYRDENPPAATRAPTPRKASRRNTRDAFAEEPNRGRMLFLRTHDKKSRRTTVTGNSNQ